MREQQTGSRRGRKENIRAVKPESARRSGTIRAHREPGEIMRVDEFTENRNNNELVSKARSKPVVVVLSLLEER